MTTKLLDNDIHIKIKEKTLQERTHANLPDKNGEIIDNNKIIKGIVLGIGKNITKTNVNDITFFDNSKLNLQLNIGNDVVIDEKYFLVRK